MMITIPASIAQIPDVIPMAMQQIQLPVIRTTITKRTVCSAAMAYAKAPSNVMMATLSKAMVATHSAEQKYVEMVLLISVSPVTKVLRMELPTTAIFSALEQQLPCAETML